MEDIDRVVRINSLYDYYKELLTDKQREYFESFYFENQSLSEIAGIYGVSRNAVYSQINLTVSALEKYESSLKLMEKDEARSVLYEKLKTMNNSEVSRIVTELEEI